jgi:hypothetical protein
MDLSIFGRTSEPGGRLSRGIWNEGVRSQLFLFGEYDEETLTSSHDSFQADHLPNLITPQRPRITMLLTKTTSKANVD